MTTNFKQETFIEQKVTYSLEFDGKFFIIKNFPARVCQETGESFFSPETVERIQEIISQNQSPKRVIETPVYEFSVA
jgi:YgiT-type zinc finger domain-containing protein